MDQDQSSQDHNGYDDDAFGQSQPITDKPVPVQSKNSTNGNGAGRFLQPQGNQPDKQGETAPRSIPVKSMLGTSSSAGDASLGAVAAWPSIPDNRAASAYPSEPAGGAARAARVARSRRDDALKTRDGCPGRRRTHGVTCRTRFA